MPLRCGLADEELKPRSVLPFIHSFNTAAEGKGVGGGWQFNHSVRLSGKKASWMSKAREGKIQKRKERKKKKTVRSIRSNPLSSTCIIQRTGAFLFVVLVFLSATTSHVEQTNKQADGNQGTASIDLYLIEPLRGIFGKERRSIDRNPSRRPVAER